ncbi:hypothetical protein N7468_004405 [Penicillium chermesinum]|uniref:Alpha/beta hydrolase n=1 Tax=Penicillium chermesinum TaxID=63820 RepID=A0A9W9P939_9EURO|nr:uncharacterized protein N7468_004405 [Penicillium chermesinum]KAJ5239786.1 hypothetical protein N7468_004405 [Penicillium chermesinum]
MHGYPRSRRETLGLEDIARRHSLRIIYPDRNGYGFTNLNSDRKIADWPADVKALAQHLSLYQFALLGGSGSSPYTLVCAHQLPAGMLSGVGIMTGAGP